MRRRELFWSLGLCLAVGLTNRYADPDHDRALIENAAFDSYSYLALADSARSIARDELPFHHAQRIAIPHAIGMLHRVVRVPVHRLFQVSAVCLELAILLVVAATLRDLSVGGRQAMVALAMLALNPWAFRPYLMFPELVNDLAFVLGLAILVRGLLRGSAGLVILGQLLASLARQTGLLLVPFAIAWVARDTKRWAGYTRARRAVTGCAVAALAGGVYLGTARIAEQLASANENQEHLLGMLHWLATQFDPRVLAEFLLKAAASPVLPLALVLGAAGRARNRVGGDSRVVRMLLFGSLCIWTQPVLAGPAITGGNAERLLTIGLVPLVLMAAITLRDAGAFADTASPHRFRMLIALLWLASLHHLYVRAPLPFAGHKALFAVVYALACIGIVLLVRFEAGGRGSAAAAAAAAR